LRSVERRGCLGFTERLSARKWHVFSDLAPVPSPRRIISQSATVFFWRRARRDLEHAEGIVHPCRPVPERRSGRPASASGASPLRAHRLCVLCEKMTTCPRAPAVLEDSRAAPGTPPFVGEHLRPACGRAPGPARRRTSVGFIGSNSLCRETGLLSADAWDAHRSAGWFHRRRPHATGRPAARKIGVHPIHRWTCFDRADGPAPDLGRTNSGIGLHNDQPVKIAVTSDCRAAEKLDRSACRRGARGLTMRARIGTPRKTLLRDAEEAADQGNRVHVRAAQCWPNCRRRLDETPLLFATGARA